MIPEIRRRGLPAVVSEALAIATSGTAAYGISIDLDVVTPEDAPGVGTPVAGGLSAAELCGALAGLAARDDLAALELVEYCPRLDADGCSARVAIDLLEAALCHARDDAQVLADPVH